MEVHRECRTNTVQILHKYNHKYSTRTIQIQLQMQSTLYTVHLQIQNTNYITNAVNERERRSPPEAEEGWFLRYLNTSCTITPNTLTLVALNTTNTLLIPRFLKTRVAEVLSYQALVHWVLLSASTLIAAHPTQHFWNICTDRQHICTGLPSLPPFEENDCTKQNVQQRERWSYAPQQELVGPGQCALCTQHLRSYAICHLSRN